MFFGSQQKSALTLAALVLLGTSACSKKTVQIPDPEPTSTASSTPSHETTPATPEPARPAELADIYFDYDQSRIRTDAMTVLNANGKALRGEIGTQVTLEGHCDERGTVEYNLALGDRRARAVKDYLVSYGVESSRISTISYGEERPAVMGHDESAWAENRRVHFARKAQGQASR
ncbi:MAG: peptidoglycan-associated lipoprotein Pal [Candidatus Eisenbacteria bacterium]